MALLDSLPARPLAPAELAALNRADAVEMAVSVDDADETDSDAGETDAGRGADSTEALLLATDAWVKALVFEADEGGRRALKSVPLGDVERYDALRSCEEAVRFHRSTGDGGYRLGPRATAEAHRVGAAAGGAVAWQEFCDGSSKRGTMTEYTVEFVGTGETIEVSDTQTVLKACIDEGIAQEYSCRVGMCLACSAKIVEGEVEQTVAAKRGLTEEEAEEYALTCMARPQSDLKLDRGKYPPSIESDAASGAGAAADD